jgi:hypothetical protein
LSKKEKNKEKKKEKKDKKRLLKKDTVAGKLKSKCCEKYKKGEEKRCKNCPRFDLDKKKE